MTTKRRIPQWTALVAGLVVVLGACTSTASTAPGGSTGTGGGTGGAPQALIDAAKAEGTLSTIALPHDWCNYGAMIDGFKAKYGLAVNEIKPDAGSGDEIEAIKANKDNKGPQAPDVIDVGITFGDPAKAEKLIQPYKVATWDSIDPKLKDPDGYWYGDYFSILTFETNTSATKAPADWADLLGADYKNKVALAGDPRASSQAYNAVYAAALANGGSLDNAQPGLDYFKKLNDAGNFVPTIAKPGTIDTGVTPVTIRWAYNALSHKDTAAGQPGDRRDRAEGRPLPRRLRPGDQRLRPASQCGQALDGVPLLRRGPGPLAEGLLPHDPPRGPEEARTCRATSSPSSPTSPAPSTRRRTRPPRPRT